MEQNENTGLVNEMDAQGLPPEESTAKETKKSNRWQPDTLGWWNIALSVLMLGLLYLPWVEVTMNDKVLLSIVPGEQLPGWAMRYVVVLCAVNIAANCFRRFSWLNASFAVGLACAFYGSMEYWNEAQQYASQAVGGIALYSSHGLFYNHSHVRFAGEDFYFSDGGFFWLAAVLAALMLVVALVCWVKTLGRIFRHKENAVLHVVIGGVGTVLSLVIYLFCAGKMDEADGSAVRMLMDLVTSQGGNVIPLLVLHIMPLAAMIGLTHALSTLLIAVVSHRKSEIVGLVPRQRKFCCIFAAVAELLILLVMFFVTIRFVASKMEGKVYTESVENPTETDDTEPERWAEGCDYEEPLLSGYKFEVRDMTDEEYMGRAPKQLVAKMPDGTEYEVEGVRYCAELKILRQGDFMDDGENVALVYEYGGGSEITPPFFVFYNKALRQFERVYGFEEAQEDPDISIATTYGHRYFVQRVGRRKDYYELLDIGVLELIERRGPVTGNVIATVTLGQVFGDREDDEEDDRIYSVDIDRDDVPDALTFSYILRYSTMALCSIRMSNGSEISLAGITGEQFQFVASAGEMPDILCDEAWLYRWDGTTYFLVDE